MVGFYLRFSLFREGGFQGLFFLNQGCHIFIQDITDTFNIFHDRHHGIYLTCLLIVQFLTADLNQVVGDLFLQVVNFPLPHMKAFQQGHLGVFDIPV